MVYGYRRGFGELKAGEARETKLKTLHPHIVADASDGGVQVISERGSNADPGHE
jgi:hypothetical protein